MCPALEGAEVENNLLLGIVGALAVGRPAVPAAGAGAERPLLAIVEDDAGALAAVAVRTPPSKLVLARAPDAALAALARGIAVVDRALPGVVGPVEAAAAFATHWSEATGASARAGMRQRVYRLDRVVEPAPVAGRLRAAGEGDVARVAEWVDAFSRDTGVERWNAEALVRRKLEDRALWLWEHRGPASMACTTGATARGIRVGLVYTPPERRGRGYASACVAAVSRAQLAAGRRWCSLFTDLANPTSNHIYQAIGYRPVCDFADYWFESQVAGSAQ